MQFQIGLYNTRNIFIETSYWYWNIFVSTLYMTNTISQDT